MSTVRSTSGRLHGEFVRLLHNILAHRRAVRFFEALGYEPCYEELCQRRGSFLFQHRALLNHHTSICHLGTSLLLCIQSLAGEIQECVAKAKKAEAEARARDAKAKAAHAKAKHQAAKEMDQNRQLRRHLQASCFGGK